MSDDNRSAADPFGEIADEFVEAFRQGKRPSVEAFARRYPEHADEIREMLPALVLMEKAKSSAEAQDQKRQARASAPAVPLQQLGDYQILREVGRGGMGVVYEAQQVSLGRHVAIKVLPAHAMLDPRQLGRFQREARSAAKLHHTNIVPVFGVGEQDGLHYYVMQFIQGLGLDVILDELRRLRQPTEKQAPTKDEAASCPTNVTRDVSAVEVARGLLTGEFTTSGGPPGGKSDELGVMSDESKQDEKGHSSLITPNSSLSSATIRLPGQTEGSTLSEAGRQYWQSVARVGVQVAQALEYASQQGVLHRDIKPSNLLLDAQGNVWVTDFGLAKGEADSDNLTHTGDIVGTLRYMAPERFSGQGDVRSDVHALGLTLYELLTLRPAFDETDRNKLVKQVMHDEPVRPRKVNRAVPRDLETVVLKAIDRDPARRYQTPAAMVEDLNRFIEDRPVKARRASEIEKFLRWCRRNPLPASLLAGIVLVFLVGFAGVFGQWREAVTAREDEKEQRGRAESEQKGAERARDEARRREEEAVTARDEAKQTRNAAARQAAGLLLDRGIEDATGGEPARALHLFVRALRALPAKDPQSVLLERVIRANLSAWAETVPALEHVWPGDGHSTDIAFSPEGDRIAMTVGKNEIECFRTDTGRPVGPPAKLPDAVGEAMAFAADGRSLWVVSPGKAKVVDQWGLHRLDPASGRPIQPPIRSPGPVDRLAVTPDGRYLVGAVLGLHPEDRGPAGDADGRRRWRTASIMVWETASGRVIRKVDVNAESDHSFMDLSPDGKSVSVWVQRGPNTNVLLTFTVDGSELPISQRLPSGSRTGGTLLFQNNMRTALVIEDGQAHRWSVKDPGLLGPGVAVSFRTMFEEPAPDGRTVTSWGENRVFDTGAWPPRPSGERFGHPGLRGDDYSKERYSLDGRFVATWRSPGEIDRRLWRLPRPHSRPPLSPAESTRLPQRKDHFHFARFDLRGTRAILWGLQRTDGIHNVWIVDVATGAVRGTYVGHSARIRDAAFTPDGRHFATASFDSTVRFWVAATGRPVGPTLQYTNLVSSVAFSPDGKTLATGDYGSMVKLFDCRTGKEIRPPLEHDDIVLCVCFSPNGRFVATVKARDWSKKPELLVWDVATGKPVVRTPYFADQSDRHLGLDDRFRPDGRVVAARDEKGVLRIWEVPSGKLLGERPLDGNGMNRFSPNSRMIAAATNLGVRLLDADTLAALRGGFLPHPDPIQDLAFSPDGAFLLTAHETGSAQLWDVATRKPVGPPAVLIGPIRAVTFTPDGKMCVCVAADGTVRRWPVPAPFAEPDLARLAERVALMTGQRMDDSQGLDFVPADKWRALRAKLAGDGSTALRPVPGSRPRRDDDWHDAVAADAEQDHDAFGAEWHLDRLATLRPNDWTISARRGRVLAAAGRRDEAAAAYAKAARLAPSRQLVSDWLRAGAVIDEAVGRKEAGLWNLDRAIQLTPGDWSLYVLRADLADPARAVADMNEAIRRGAAPSIIGQAAIRAADSRDWKRSAALFTSLARNPTFTMNGHCLQAVACLKAGDTAGYRAACAGILKRIAPVGPTLFPRDAKTAAMAFALGPNATEDWSKPLAWIDHALGWVTLAESRNMKYPGAKDQLRYARCAYLNTRAAILYRAGRFAEAAKVLREGMSLHPKGGDYLDWVLLALTEHRLGHADAAKAAVSKARAAKAGAKPETVWAGAEAELLAAELDAALPPAGK